MISLLLMSLLVQAAPQPSFPQNVNRQSVRELVKTSMRSEELKELGPAGYKHLREIMLSETESVETRWNATLALAQIGGSDSLPDIEKTLKNSTWFMRSAGLLATSLVDKKRAYRVAKEFMSHDPALLVRASALQVLAQDPQLDRTYLWKELYNPRNFIKGRGLSIRHSILQVLAVQASKAESAQFVALMREDDPQIQRLAEQGLESIYKVQPPKGLSSQKKLAYWQKEETKKK